MKVNLVRSGGFAGLTVGWEVRIDEVPDADRWKDLVAACPWDEPDQVSPGADRFVYRFRAGRRSAVLGEEHIEGPWRELADRLRTDGRPLPPR